MKPLTRLAAVFPGGRILLLVTVAAALLTGCGGNDGTIPADQGDTLVKRLDEVEGAVADGNCDGAQASADLFSTQVSQLPAEVDDEVKQGLIQGAQRLRELAGAQCEPATPTGPSGETGVLPEQPTEQPGTTESTSEEPTQEAPADNGDSGTGQDGGNQDGGNQGGGGGNGSQDGGTGAGTGGVGGGGG
jgi:hypothetical protein